MLATSVLIQNVPSKFKERLHLFMLACAVSLVADLARVEELATAPSLR